MSDNEAIIRSADNLARIFGVILALAIGEAFKQFVAEPDKASKPTHKTKGTDKKTKNAGPDNPDTKAKTHIHWDRLPALIALMLLIVPFFHGIERLFYDWYHTSQLRSNYARGLAVDFFVCTTLAAMFFILSRSLPPAYWPRFYKTVCILLLLDLAWIAFHHNQTEMLTWGLINGIMLIVLAIILYADRCEPSLFNAVGGMSASLPDRVLEWFRKPYRLTLLMLIRTACDYGFNWYFYFPTPARTSLLRRMAALIFAPE